MKYADVPAGCECNWVEDRSISTAPEDGEWTLTRYNVRCPVHKPALCNFFVSWWDGEYEGNCELPEGHEGPHYDGLSWYNDDWDEVEA